MNLKVGIPGGLYYYKYLPMWKTFFEEIGAEVVTSQESNKSIIDAGVKSCVNEACYPVKLYHGHVLNLIGKVDYIFIPRLTSISKGEYICPKIGGLPDMVRNTIKGLPEVIDTEINLRRSQRSELRAFLEIGKYFTDNNTKVKKAYKKASIAYAASQEALKKGDAFPKNKDNSMKIALFGHSYMLYDSFINLNLVKKLKNQGIDIITVDMVDGSYAGEDPTGLNKSLKLNKKMFWNFGSKAVAAAANVLERKDIDGIIYVMSFGCGVDSFVCDFIERNIRRACDIPFAVITLDECSGEAGLNTRLEAFVDMIGWRKKSEDNVSAYG